jgi:hypothetical protein
VLGIAEILFQPITSYIPLLLTPPSRDFTESVWNDVARYPRVANQIEAITRNLIIEARASVHCS